MILKTKKILFFGDSTLIKNIRIAILPSVSKLLLLLFLLVSLDLFSGINNPQVPIKAKSKVVSVKSSKSKGKKVKKKVIIKKDTLKDIDPTSVNSPLYNQ